MKNDIPGLNCNKFKPAYKKYVVFTNINLKSQWGECIDKNYTKILELFTAKGFKFINYPTYICSKENFEDTTPFFNAPDTKEFYNINFERLYLNNPLLEHIVSNLSIHQQSLIYYWGYDNQYFYFTEFQLPIKQISKRAQLKIIKRYISELNRKINNGYNFKFMADNKDGLTTWNLKKLDNCIKNLRLLDISRFTINQALCCFRHLSQMVITNDNRILLPFYEVEIKMSPLPKALYFLFLNHPEGIILKNMPDYKDELYKIYLALSPAENLDKIKKSIDKLCDPLDNSINEKCSRIREAFLKHFEENLACIYYISGNARELRYIWFAREFVHVGINWDIAEEEKDQYYVPIITTPQGLQEILKGKNSN